MKKALLLGFIVPLLAAGQISQDVDKEKKSYVFAQIFADFGYSFKDSFKPQAAFNFNQGIIGYYHQLSKNISGKIMYDVTRTTHIYEITDSAGIQMNINYFEGSKFTGYLKMAEIKWDVTDWFTFRVGQLLSTQYLTFQDRFWGYRYIDVTFQEKFRMGMPADFGVQFDFRYKDIILNQVSVVNGEGPFRYQDINGKFLYSNNLQVYPMEGLKLKFYIDFAPPPDTGQSQYLRSVVAFFAGYQTQQFRVGGELVWVNNAGWSKELDHNGFSIFGSYFINEKFEILARYDHLYFDQTGLLSSQYLDYYIIGAQYQPIENFTTSLNFRYYSKESLPFIYASFGLKF